MVRPVCGDLMTVQDVELIVFDDDMDPVGRIKNAESFTYTENWYEPDTFEIRIDATKIDLYQLLTEIQTQGHIGYLADDNTVKIGIIEDIKKPSGAAGEQWTITGRGILALLERRKLMNGYSTSTGFDVQTAVAYETAMRYYVNNNCIAAKGPAGTSDTNRNITGLSLAEVDYERGVDCNFQGRAQSLLDTLVEFSKASELSCDLVWSGAAAAPTARYTFVFTVYASTDRTADVILTMNLGNILSYDYQESVLGYRNLIYVAGTGSANTRALSEIYSGTEPTGRDRFEDYIDATDCATTAQLTQRGNETLALKAGTESLEFEYNTESQAYTYGTDFVCGDIVTVIDPDVATIIDRITSVTTTYDENGKTIKLGMGTSAPDLVSIMKMDRKQNTGVRR